MTGTVRNPDVPLDLAHCEDHGYACKTYWQWENAIKACRIIADYKPNVKFAFETHMYYLHDTAKTTRELVDAIDRPNFGINLDYGNALFFPHTESLEEAIQLIADNKVSPYDSQPMPECGFDPLEMEILDEDGVIVYES